MDGVEKKKTTSLSTAFVWQLMTAFFQYGLGFLVTPIFTRVLSTDEYGVVATFTTLVTLIGIVISVQTKSTMGNAKNKYETGIYEKYISSSIGISITVSAAVLIIFTVLRNPLGKILGFEPLLVPLLVVQAFVVYVVDYYVVYLRYDFRIKKSSLIAMLKGVAVSAFSLILLFVLKENKYLSKIYGTIIPCLVLSVVFLALLFRKGKCFFYKEYWQYCLKLSVPLVGLSISYMIMSQSDRLMLRYMVSDAEAGVYSVVYVLATIINMVKETINQAWAPFYFKLKAEKSDALFEKIRSIRSLFSGLSVVFLLCSVELFKLIAPEPYWGGLQLIPLVIIAVFCDFLYIFPSNYELYSERTRISMGATVVCAIANVVLNYFLIPRFQGFGAMIATVISAVLMIIIHDFFCRRIIRGYEIPIPFYVVSTLPIILAAVVYYVFMGNPIVRWGLAGIIMIIFIAIATKKGIIFKGRVRNK